MTSRPCSSYRPVRPPNVLPCCCWLPYIALLLRCPPALPPGPCPGLARQCARFFSSTALAPHWLPIGSLWSPPNGLPAVALLDPLFLAPDLLIISSLETSAGALRGNGGGRRRGQPPERPAQRDEVRTVPSSLLSSALCSLLSSILPAARHSAGRSSFLLLSFGHTPFAPNDPMGALLMIRPLPFVGPCHCPSTGFPCVVCTGINTL